MFSLLKALSWILIIKPIVNKNHVRNMYMWRPTKDISQRIAEKPISDHTRTMTMGVTTKPMINKMNNAFSTMPHYSYCEPYWLADTKKGPIGWYVDWILVFTKKPTEKDQALVISVNGLLNGQKGTQYIQKNLFPKPQYLGNFKVNFHVEYLIFNRQDIINAMCMLLKQDHIKLNSSASELQDKLKVYSDIIRTFEFTRQPSKESETTPKLELPQKPQQPPQDPEIFTKDVK